MAGSCLALTLVLNMLTNGIRMASPAALSRGVMLSGPGAFSCFRPLTSCFTLIINRDRVNRWSNPVVVVISNWAFSLYFTHKVSSSLLMGPTPWFDTGLVALFSRCVLVADVVIEMSPSPVRVVRIIEYFAHLEGGCFNIFSKGLLLKGFVVAYEQYLWFGPLCSCC